MEKISLKEMHGIPDSLMETLQTKMNHEHITLAVNKFNDYYSALKLTEETKGVSANKLQIAENAFASSGVTYLSTVWKSFVAESKKEGTVNLTETEMAKLAQLGRAGAFEPSQLQRLKKALGKDTMKLTLVDKNLITSLLDTLLNQVLGSSQVFSKVRSNLKTEEVEQIDELSNDTMRSYVNKAHGDAESAHKSKQLGKPNTKINKRIGKRLGGMNRALGKLTKEDSETVEESNIPWDRKPAKISKNRLDKYREKKAKNADLLTQIRAADAKKKMAKEDVEQIDEGRPLYAIAKEIKKDWGAKVNYAAKPYLDAMSSMDSIKDNYYQDSGKSVVAYFLSNATSWRGEKAKEIKAELKAMLKEDVDEARSVEQWTSDVYSNSSKYKEISKLDKLKKKGKGNWAIDARIKSLKDKIKEDADQLDETRPEYNEDGRGRFKVNYVSPDKKNIGNDRFESKAEAAKFANSLKKKGYKDVSITEQKIHEMSPKNLEGYMEKSEEDYFQTRKKFMAKMRKGSTGDEESDVLRKRLSKRGTGMNRASRLLKKKMSEEQIDEISADKARAYIKATDDGDNWPTDKKKRSNRTVGRWRAKDIVAKKGTDDEKEYAAAKSRREVAQNRYSGRMDNHPDLEKANKDYDAASKKKYQKEEQINELSKSTLSSYKQNATVDASQRAEKGRDLIKIKTLAKKNNAKDIEAKADDASKSNYKKLMNRVKGLDRARSKSKE